MDIVIANKAPETETGLRGEFGHRTEADDILLAKRAAELLNKHYPGHLWAVNVNSEGGVMIIKNYRLSFLYGMVLHLRTVYADPGLRCVLRSGGELLERAHMRRGSATGEGASVLEGVEKRHEPVFKAGIVV